MTRMNTPVAQLDSITLDEAVDCVRCMRRKKKLPNRYAENFSGAVGADVARPILDAVRRITEDVKAYYGPEECRDPCLAIYLNYQNPNGPYQAKVECAEEIYLDILIKSSYEDPGCWDGLHTIANYHLDRSSPLPDLLQQWMNRRTSRPVAERGGNPDRDAIRNVGIDVALNFLKSRGMSPARDEGSPRTSACDAVAEAVHLSFDSVLKVWKKRKIWSPDLDRALFAYELEGPGG